MEVRDRPRLASWVYGVAAVVTLAVAVVMLVEVLTHAGGFRAPHVKSVAGVLLWILVATVAAVLWAWWHDARAARRLLEAERRARQEAERELGGAAAAIEAARAQADSEVERQRDELESERERLARAERSRQAEREWADELRDQVAKLQRESGVLGAGGDLRELVLRVAIELLDAEKGLLLERGSGDGADGDGLEVTRALGFDNDAKDSGIVHRLGAKVLERDETLREDDEAKVDEESRTPADDEITNLVAIPMYVADEFSGVVVCANRDGGFAEVEDDLLLALGTHAGALLDHGRLQGELRNAYLATVSVLAGALEAKDPFLRGHSDEVAGYVAAVATKVGIEPARREELVFGSLLHDVGKLGISERILLKPGALTPEERAVIELHPRIGFHLVEQVPALRPIAPAVLHHHERFDGGGYPNGLSGTDIPLEARIVCVADCFSAMTGERTYRDPLTREQACEELVRGAGTQFDPEIVRVFVDEVRCSEPREARSAIDNAELRAMRGEGEPLLGSGAASVTDALTFLYSHRYLQERAAAEAQRAALQDRPFSIIVGELAGLGDVNRERGFAAGDRALRAAATAFEHAGDGAAGVVAARLSGRRLALLVPGDGADAERRLAVELEGGPLVRLGRATWGEGDDGVAVVERAVAAARGERAVMVDGQSGDSIAPASPAALKGRRWLRRRTVDR